MAPISVYTSGKGSPAAGLTATVVQDANAVSARRCTFACHDRWTAAPRARSSIISIISELVEVCRFG